MFKRFKDRLSEVSEEVKRDPRFQNSLQSVNSLAEKTVAAIKNEPEGTPQTGVALSDLNQSPFVSPAHRRSQSSDLIGQQLDFLQVGLDDFSRRMQDLFLNIELLMSFPEFLLPKRFSNR